MTTLFFRDMEIKPEQYQSLLAELTQLVPADQLYTDPLRTFGWGTDASFYRMVPKIVIRSDSEEQVSAIVKACARHHVPYTFRAAGTSLSGQSVSDSVLIVAGKHWERYEVYDEGKTIRMQPGIVGGRVNAILKPWGRVLPPDPASVNSAMVGGIICNNASGMNCGVHANSDHMLVSARIILPDGTLLDTGDEQSRRDFRKTHPDFLAQIEKLRDEVRANKSLVDRINYKYSIKNVTGLNIRPLVAYDDPFDIIAHSMVGSEGTLAFLAEVKMKTLQEYPYRASALVYFKTMEESCRCVVAMKQLKASPHDLEISYEDLMVKSAEMLDYLSLNAVNDPVFLQYKKDVDEGRIEGVEPGDYHNLTAILTETKASTPEELKAHIQAVTACMSQFDLYRPVAFTDDPHVYQQYWAIRSGIFPSVGGTRPVGTSCLIEDVAFHIEDLPEATVRLQRLIAEHGYKDACIYGHAFEGNYHFILNQSFKSEEEVNRYAGMMKDVAKLVIGDYHGSLKAEHGTGRNMAPFVKYEWGEEAFDVMRRLKDIFDPCHLLNPGVIFNDDPDCFIKNLKHLPVLSFPVDKIPDGAKYLPLEEGKVSSTQMMKEAVDRANKCIECGFCEVNCVSCGLTLSSRMRIAIQREICELEQEGGNRRQAEELRKQYRYQGNQTCASDGLCSTSCPMKINTGEITHLIRQLDMMQDKTGYAIGKVAAQHLGSLKSGLRGVLGIAGLGQEILGSRNLYRIGNMLHKVGIPQWIPTMPAARRQPSQKDLGRQPETDLKMVYFPSCINQTMGLSKGAPVKNSVVDEMVQLIHKAGYEVIFPTGMQEMCCGQIWESKGMMDIADQKSGELENALWEASQYGKYPILCDQSPCLHRMRKTMHKLKLYEPVEFIMTFLKDRLDFHPIDRRIAIHVTCSTRELGLTAMMLNLARLCTPHVLLPEGVGCCGFAGDRGFTFPELNKYALRKLRPQIEKENIEIGYSNSRTCEIGLQYHAGIPYLNIAYLVNECTTRKKERL